MNVWIAGASGAVGRAVAEARRALGDRVVSVDRHAAGPDGVPLDLTAPDAPARLRAAVDRLGPPDAVVCAMGGWAGGHRLVDAPPEELDAQLAVNLVGPARLIGGLLPPMIGRGGHWVFFLSDAAHGPAPGMAAYGAAKAGLAALVASLRAEHAEDGVRFHTLSPGTIDTEGNRQAMPEANPAAWVPRAALVSTIGLLLAGAAPGGADVRLRSR